MSAGLKQSLLLATFGAVAALGCSRMNCGDRCRYGSPYAGMKYDCACETCGPNCGPSCGEMACGCAQEASCAVACGDGCDRSSRLLGRACHGCGELYWNEWFNDPPAVCEPCDCHGNYVGVWDVGYFQAPYLHGAEYAQGPAAVPPLEVAPSAESPLSPSSQEPQAAQPLAPQEQANGLVNPLAADAE